jgi:hypothetical protein
MSILKEEAARVLAEKAAKAAQVSDVPPSEADALGDAATDAEAESQRIDEAVVGISYPSALTMKSFLPAGDPAWLGRTMAGQSRGAVTTSLGRIMGRVTSTEPKTTMWEGKEIKSIALHGQFRGLVTQTGQLLSSGTLFLSRTFAQEIANGLADAQQHDPGATVSVDIDVGVESTGKASPLHTWTVTHYLSGVAVRALRELQAPRRVAGSKPQPLLTAAE